MRSPASSFQGKPTKTVTMVVPSQRTGTGDPEKQTPVAEMEAPLFRKLMPLQFECTTGAVMIGNNDLRHMIVAEVAQASGTYSATRSRTEMDHYKSVLDLSLRKPQISLKSNMDFTPDEVDSDDAMAETPPKRYSGIFR